MSPRESCGMLNHDIDGPGLCKTCGEHVGSVVSREPYDYGAARRELEAVHAFLRQEAGIGQDDDGEWGVVEGYYEPEWTEWGGTVEALRKLVDNAGFEGYCRAQVESGIAEERLRDVANVLDRGIPDERKLATINRLVNPPRPAAALGDQHEAKP
jgi:hypothetical protein